MHDLFVFSLKENVVENFVMLGTFVTDNEIKKFFNVGTYLYTY